LIDPDGTEPEVTGCPGARQPTANSQNGATICRLVTGTRRRGERPIRRFDLVLAQRDRSVDSSPALPAAEAPARRAVPDSTRVVLIALVIAAAAFRLWGLGADRLNFDEAFTAMAGRLPLSDLFQFLRVHDSHPPLDYLLHAPLAQIGANEFLFRLPSALCSIAAVALFAWWVRHRGLVGIVATGLLAFSAFQLVHGRQARMYADMELIGVATVVLADTWLRRPRSWHAPAIGALVMVGLLTHVSMFLLGAGLLLLAGRRTDREAWRWRAGLAAGAAGWGVLWGPSFLVQTRGGHSDWIPRTTVARMIDTYGRLITYHTELHLFVLIAVGLGAVVLVRSDRKLGRVWLCCVLVPAALAALTGTVAPVLLDRTLTVVSWGPLLAIAFLVGAVAKRSRLAGTLSILLLAVIMIPPALTVVTQQSNPDRILRHIARVARPGDVVAIHPAGRFHELVWSIGVRGDPYRLVSLPGIAHTKALEIGTTHPLTGRTWLLDWTRHRLQLRNQPTCAHTWARAGADLHCLVRVRPTPYRHVART
jgi:hypothetical protein